MFLVTYFLIARCPTTWPPASLRYVFPSLEYSKNLPLLPLSSLCCINDFWNGGNGWPTEYWWAAYTEPCEQIGIGSTLVLYPLFSCGEADNSLGSEPGARLGKKVILMQCWPNPSSPQLFYKHCMPGDIDIGSPVGSLSLLDCMPASMGILMACPRTLYVVCPFSPHLHSCILGVPEVFQDTILHR